MHKYQGGEKIRANSYSARAVRGKNDYFDENKALVDVILSNGLSDDSRRFQAPLCLQRKMPSFSPPPPPPRIDAIVGRRQIATYE